MGFAELVGKIFLDPWYESLRDPARAQEKLLRELLEAYGETLYGQAHGAPRISDLEDYRRSFPAMTYQDLKPHLEETRRGTINAILPDPPKLWVMTRGSTGPSKILPVTQRHIDQVRTCGARAILNFALKNPESEILAGKVLNLNFPSVVGTLDFNGRKMPYGYSSGTYARLIPRLFETSLVPTQREIDALGPGIRREDWNARFDLVYERSKDEDVRAAMGVAPVISSFAAYVKRTRHVLPKEIWTMAALFCTSVPKIHTKYAPRLRYLYGEVPVIEMYTATEGIYGQQLDSLPYFCPNFDAYLFEVETGEGTKMLWELRRGEWGRLIVSSCLFPRYLIGDMIEAMGKQHFRVFGRDRRSVILEHRLYRFLTRWFI